MRNPPPHWVGQAVFPVYPYIEESGIVPGSWLPIAKAPDRLDDELGCGVYGCVLSTSDPAVVLKATTDDNESRFVAALLEMGDEAPYAGLVRYYAILDTGQDAEMVKYVEDGFRTKVYRWTDRVYLLWREVAVHVGVDTAKEMPALPEVALGGVSEEYLSGFAYLVDLEKFENQKSGWGKLAYDNFEDWHANEYGQRAEDIRQEILSHKWFTPDEIRDLQKFSKQIVGYSGVARMAYKFQQESPGKVDELQKFVKGARQGITYLRESNNPTADAIAFTLGELLDRGILLGDLNLGNFGLVQRPEGDVWVITDPGQAVFLDPKWLHIEIPIAPALV